MSSSGSARIFPKAGSSPRGESTGASHREEALCREVYEEVGIAADAYRITARSGPHRYDFPAGPDRRGFDGQEQFYFLCSLIAETPPVPDLSGTCGEFSALRWVDAHDFPVHLAPKMKQEVYRAVFAAAVPREPGESH